MDDRQMIDSILDLVSEAAIVVKNGEVVGINEPAKKILGSELPRHLVLPSRKSGEDFSLEIGGKSYIISEAPFKAAEAYIIKPMRHAEDDQYLSILENTGIAIRNSLSVSFAAASILFSGLEDRNETDMLPYLAMIKHNQHKLLHQAENIENVIAFERGEGSLNPEPTDMIMLCENLSGTVSVLINKDNIKFTFRSLCGSAVILADHIKTESMLLNLISNSIKNTPKGGEINLILSKNSGYIMLTLTDSGSGIKPENMDTIFEAYKRPKNYSDALRGIGMGMASALHIARLHGGNIFVNTKENEGTIVSIALPDKTPDFSELKSHSSIYDEDAMSRVLTGLADVLDHSHFMGRFDV